MRRWTPYREASSSVRANKLYAARYIGIGTAPMLNGLLLNMITKCPGASSGREPTY